MKLKISQNARPYKKFRMKDTIFIPNEIIENKIYLIRNVKVMLDSDLALLYGVETKQLKR